MTDWFMQLKNSKKSSIVDNNCKKIHYDFGNGQEMVEEYNLDTNVLTQRAWKRKTELKTNEEWEVEIGDPIPKTNKDEIIMIKENSSQPFISRRITKKNLEWRIRNLPYPIDTYSVTADPQNKCLIVRTTNKKYYKQLSIPDLDRLHLLPEQVNVSFSHKFNTLIVTYKKPPELLVFEKKLLEELDQIKPTNQPNMDCKPS